MFRDLSREDVRAGGLPPSLVQAPGLGGHDGATFRPGRSQAALNLVTRVGDSAKPPGAGDHGHLATPLGRPLRTWRPTVMHLRQARYR